MFWQRLFSLVVGQSNGLVPVALYHLCEPASSNPLVSDHAHNVEPQHFCIQLESIRKKYKVVFVDELAERLSRGKNLNRLAAITFDDAYKSVVQQAAPILNALSIPFTFFVNGKIVETQMFWRDKVRHLINTNQVDDFLREYQSPMGLTLDNFYRQSKVPAVNSLQLERLLDEFYTKRKITLDTSNLYCDWNDLHGYSGKNMMVGNHSYSHFVLSGLTAQEQYGELEKNQRAIKKYFEESSIFSIPFGNEGMYNDDTLDVINQLGYKGYLLSGSLTSCRNSKMDKFGLARISRFMPTNVPFIKGISG